MKLKLAISLAVLAAVLFGAAFTAPAQASGLCTQYHTVQPGENLFRVSLRYNVTMQALLGWNYIPNPNRIYAGQTLCVSQVQPQPQPQPRTYVVQRGDWLSRIARSFGVNPWVLAQVNHLTNPNLIHAGQVLVIPDFTIQ